MPGRIHFVATLAKPVLVEKEGTPPGTVIVHYATQGPRGGKRWTHVEPRGFPYYLEVRSRDHPRIRSPTVHAGRVPPLRKSRSVPRSQREIKEHAKRYDV